MARAQLQVIELNSRARVARDVRHRLFSDCRRALQQAGNDLSGFALVTWTRDGDLHSAYDARHGLIGPGLVPTLVADTLNRHQAIMRAKRLIEEGD